MKLVGNLYIICVYIITYDHMLRNRVFFLTPKTAV